MRSILAVVVLTVLFTAGVYTAHAGMYIKKQVGRDQTEEVFIDSGRMKIVTGYRGMGTINVSIVDTTGERFILVQPARKVYLEVTFREYKEFFEDMQKQMGIPSVESMNPSDIPFAVKEEEETRRYAGSGEKIAGYSTKLLVIERGGREVERRWVSERFIKDILKEIDIKKLGGLGGTSGTMAILLQAESIRAMAEEMPLKEVNLLDRTASTVVKVEHRRFPPSVFSPPEGYRRVDIKEFFFPGGNIPFQR